MRDRCSVGCRIIDAKDKKKLHLKSQWFSGKIRACHARAPCSIHGCDIRFVLLLVNRLKSQFFWMSLHL
jgi:hypothetical protein